MCSSTELAKHEALKLRQQINFLDVIGNSNGIFERNIFLNITDVECCKSQYRAKM